jgi:hypothetical protein
MSNLELQALLLVSELELFVAAGDTLPDDIIISINNFRMTELLVTGSNDYKVRDMVAAIRKEVSKTNNH